MHFIGDVHGKYNRYRTIIKDLPPTIQVGDMGVGFRDSHGEYLASPPYDQMVAGNHRFIRGNHDNPCVCASHSQWIKDGHTENSMMFVGGGVSIDREFRREGYSWWADEELSLTSLSEIVSDYCRIKPEIMVTHDCPEEIAQRILHKLTVPSVKLDPRHSSRTRQAFSAMLTFHRPKLWVFGHWHISFDETIEGTRFVCLAELECRDLS